MYFKQEQRLSPLLMKRCLVGKATRHELWCPEDIARLEKNDAQRNAQGQEHGKLHCRAEEPKTRCMHSLWRSKLLRRTRDNSLTHHSRHRYNLERKETHQHTGKICIVSSMAKTVEKLAKKIFLHRGKRSCCATIPVQHARFTDRGHTHAP